MTEPNVSIERQKEIEDYWVKQCLRTDPADRDMGEDAIRRLYESHNITPPPIEWVLSPTEGEKRIRELGYTGDVYGCVFYGCMDAAWNSFYQILSEDPDYAADVQPYLPVLDAGRSCAWFWPFDTVCIAMERVEILAVDENLRPHSADGPAILWRDGQCVYCWHGIAVPPRVIEEPESYTREEILELGNSEVTRVLVERMGWAELMEKLGTVKLDAWTDPETGLEYELHRSSVVWGELQPNLLKKQSPLVKDGTQPVYFETVHPALDTCKQARKFQAMAAFLDDVNDESEIAALITHIKENPELVYNQET